MRPTDSRTRSAKAHKSSSASARLNQQATYSELQISGCVKAVPSLLGCHICIQLSPCAEPSPDGCTQPFLPENLIPARFSSSAWALEEDRLVLAHRPCTHGPHSDRHLLGRPVQMSERMHAVIRLDSSPLGVGAIRQCGKGMLGSPLSSTAISVTEAVT